MKKHLISKEGNFYKANLHCHSTCSDGHKTPEEIKEIYKEKGYSIVAYTDHDILISHDYLNDNDFLALHGFEMEINEEKEAPFIQKKTCHICFIAIEPENLIQSFWNRKVNHFIGDVGPYLSQVKFDANEPDYFREYSHECISDIMTKAREKGFFVTYNHPTWSLEDYSNYMGYSGMNAMEMFNGTSLSCGYDEYNSRVYDDILRSGRKIFCIGADDNHNEYEGRRCDSGWAYTVIKADSLDYCDVTKALVNGNFYASTGPEIYELWFEDGMVHIKCSDADKITCVFQWRAAGIYVSIDDVPLNEGAFGIRPEYGYFRIIVVDKKGRRACTNAYFPEDVF